MKRLFPLFAILLVCSGVAAVIIVPGPGAKHSVLANTSILDDMESYTANATINGLNGGTGFSSVYVDRPNLTGVQQSDDVESYSDGATLNSLNGGNGFSTAYVDRDNPLGVKASDNVESYSDGASINGLNGGTGWTTAIVDR